MRTCVLISILLLTPAAFGAESIVPAANAINSLGIDLLHKIAKPDTNVLLSPYSIETSLVMAYAGAGGVTREEMVKVLHLGTNEARVHASFGLLQKQMDGMVLRSAQSIAERKQQNYAEVDEPIKLTIANRLFGQEGYLFQSSFLDRLKTNYGAPLELVDFVGNSAGARKSINHWVEEQTRQRIRDVIPDRALDEQTRLVLVNAIYLKAPWETEFNPGATEPRSFHLTGGTAVDVPTMFARRSLGYMKYNGFTAITIPYRGGELQLLILLPDTTNGLAQLESEVRQFASYTGLPAREVALSLPKFKIEPSTLALTKALQALGMKTAFAGLADFSRMGKKGLFIQEVYHKTFLNLDEKGTEAAAATAEFLSLGMPPRAIEVKVDHPFIFAVQHRASGACLFLGHVANPR